MRPFLAVGLAPAALTIGAAGRGGGSQSGTTSAWAYGASRPASKAAAGAMATARTELGPTVVDAHGRTLYL